MKRFDRYFAKLVSMHGTSLRYIELSVTSSTNSAWLLLTPILKDGTRGRAVKISQSTVVSFQNAKKSNISNEDNYDVASNLRLFGTKLYFFFRNKYLIHRKFCSKQ